MRLRMTGTLLEILRAGMRALRLLFAVGPFSGGWSFARRVYRDTLRGLPTIWGVGRCLPPLIPTRVDRQQHLPHFTVILTLSDHSADRLAESIEAVQQQGYPHWRLLCVTRRTSWSRSEQTLLSSADPRVIPVVLGDKNEYALLEQQFPWTTHFFWQPAGDWLAPHALNRLAEAVLAHDPDLIYADEEEVGEQDEILAIHARQAFSADDLLARDYLGRLLAVRAGRFLDACGPHTRVLQRPDFPTLLRLVAQSAGVSHIPEVLYRHRVSAQDPGPETPATDLLAVRQHLHQLGIRAEVRPLPNGQGRDVIYPCPPWSRVAIIIPTRDRLDLLRRCLESLEATVPDSLADIWVVDHDSQQPKTLAYLQGLAGRHRVISYNGPFNFSALNNQAVARAARTGSYSHYLLLNNDTEGLAAGWLERMVGLASRSDVGIVGALLLYPDGRVQHAGMIVGLHYSACNRGRGQPADGPWSRSQAAVTGACMLIRADVHARLGGLDERFTVGFGDVDLCLRTQAAGYKVLLDPGAILLHHESATRSITVADPHPHDTRLFRQLHRRCILAWDPYSSPRFSRYDPLTTEPTPPGLAPIRHVATGERTRLRRKQRAA